MFDHHLIQGLVVSVGDQRLSLFFIEGLHFFQQSQEGASAVIEMSKPMFDFGCAERMHIETNVFAVLSITIAIQNPHLVESGTKIGAAERFVLIVFETVLVVEVNGPQLSERHGEVHFIGGVESCQDAVGAFNQRAGAFRVPSLTGDSEHVADGRHVCVIHGLVGFGLDRESDFFVVSQHFVEGLDQELDTFQSVFGFAEIGAFTRQPQYEDIRAKHACDIDALFGAIDGVSTAFLVIAGVGAIDGFGAEPESGRDHFGSDSGVIQAAFQLLGLFEDLAGAFVIDVGDGIIVVEHHGVEAEFLESFEFPIEGDRRTSCRSVRVRAFTDIPGTKTKLEWAFLRHSDGCER